MSDLWDKCHFMMALSIWCFGTGRRKTEVESKLSERYQHICNINCTGFLQYFVAPFSPTIILVFVSIFDIFGAVMGRLWKKKQSFKNSSVLAHVI